MTKIVLLLILVPQRLLVADFYQLQYHIRHSAVLFFLLNNPFVPEHKVCEYT